jgi:hypothetical protein
MPTKDSHARTRQPLALTNGHGRCTTVAPERTLVPVEEWPLHTAAVNVTDIDQVSTPHLF